MQIKLNIMQVSKKTMNQTQEMIMCEFDDLKTEVT